MNFGLLQPVEIYPLLPTAALCVLYSAIVFLKRRPLGREYHLGFLFAIACCGGFLLVGIASIQPGMLGNLSFFLVPWFGVPAAVIGFALGWSVGIVSLQWMPTRSDDSNAPALHPAPSRRKKKIALSILILALVAVPIDYLVRRNTPRWVGTSSTGTVKSDWMCMTIRALYPYDWGDQYVPLVSLLLPPGEYRILGSSIGKPSKDKNGHLVFEFGSAIPALTVKPEYSVFEFRSGAWVEFEHTISDQQLQKFIREPLLSHSIEQLQRFLEQ